MNFAHGNISGHLASIFVLALGLAAAGCDGDSNATGGGGTGGAGGADQPDVVEIAVRRLNEGQDVAQFEAARDAFVAELKKQSQEAFMAIAQDAAFLGAPEVQAFLGTYPPAGGYVNIVLE